MSKFSASVRNLFAGSSLSSPPEDDEDAGAAAEAAAPKAGPSASAIEASLVKADADATAAANKRWNTVMTSDAGVANPKAAARLLNSSTMAADDIVATLGDISPATSSEQTNANAQQRQQQAEADRQALADDAEARPNTGGAGGGKAARTGEGESANGVREARAKRRESASKKPGVKRANQSSSN